MIIHQEHLLPRIITKIVLSRSTIWLHDEEWFDCMEMDWFYSYRMNEADEKIFWEGIVAHCKLYMEGKE